MRFAPVVTLFAATLLALEPAAFAQPPTGDSEWMFTARNLTRVESWRFFEPPSPEPDPTYAFLANRLQLEVRRSWTRADLTLTAQHVGFLGLPAAAAGPGPFGTGALYFSQGGGRERPQRLYLRYANVRVRDVVPGLDVQAGRMAYASGAEASSGVAKIEAVKRQRLNARLVGEFEWSIYQRSFDGVRIDWTRPSAVVTGIALMPTQGGFARLAGPTMTDIRVLGATVSHTRRHDTGGTQLQGFAIRYDDDRPVAARVDNTGRGADRVDVGVTSIGGTLIGAYPAASGEADLFVWTTVQSGDWFDDRHRAFAIAAEGGFQWRDTRWRPWLRGGVFRASGDDDPDDTRHGTFFPMLPTVRRFSQTTAYSTMNLDDLFAQVLLSPRGDLSLRLDLHWLRLASAADRWYAGSGATLTTGGGLGYAGRPSSGERGLGTSLEVSATYTATPRWTLSGFVGSIRGGPVVTALFAGDHLWFGYLESVVRIGR